MDFRSAALSIAERESSWSQYQLFRRSDGARGAGGDCQSTHDSSRLCLRRLRLTSPEGKTLLTCRDAALVQLLLCFHI